MNRLVQLGVLTRAGMQAMNCGRHADALFQLSQAEMIAKQIGSPLHEAKVNNSIGLVHLMSGDEAKALERFRIAEKSAIKGAGEDNCLHKTIKRNMSRLEQAA